MSDPFRLDDLPIRKMAPAIIERLRLVFPKSHKFTIERVPPVLTLDEFKRLTRQTPFIGLAWTDMNNDRQAGQSLQGIWQWRLIMIVKASGDLERRFSGDSRDVGIDAMVDVASAILNGHSFDDIGACHVTNAKALYAEGDGNAQIVIAHVDFEIRTTFQPALLELEEPEDFKGFINAVWGLPDTTQNGEKSNG